MRGHIHRTFADAVVNAVHIGHDERALLRPDARRRVVVQPHAPDFLAQVRLGRPAFAALRRGGDERHPPIAVIPPDVETFFQETGQTVETIVQFLRVQPGHIGVQRLGMVIEHNADVLCVRFLKKSWQIGEQIGVRLITRRSACPPAGVHHQHVERNLVRAIIINLFQCGRLAVIIPAAVERAEHEQRRHFGRTGQLEKIPPELPIITLRKENVNVRRVIAQIPAAVWGLASGVWVLGWRRKTPRRRDDSWRVSEPPRLWLVGRAGQPPAVFQFPVVSIKRLSAGGLDADAVQRRGILRKGNEVIRGFDANDAGIRFHQERRARPVAVDDMKRFPIFKTSRPSQFNPDE